MGTLTNKTWTRRGRNQRGGASCSPAQNTGMAPRFRPLSRLLVQQRHGAFKLGRCHASRRKHLPSHPPFVTPPIPSLSILFLHFFLPLHVAMPLYLFLTLPWFGTASGPATVGLDGLLNPPPPQSGVLLSTQTSPIHITCVFVARLCGVFVVCVCVRNSSTLHLPNNQEMLPIPYWTRGRQPNLTSCLYTIPYHFKDRYPAAL